MHTPLQKAWNTDLPAFIWVQTKPANLTHFNQFMVGGRLGMPTWLDVYPWRAQTQGLKPDQPLFVDVGGGLGAQCIALRDKVPNLPNKIILQDQAATLQHFIKHPGVEAMVYDFFLPQVIKGQLIVRPNRKSAID
jgi:demethylsterigmatocystin 6-O-methyltransferase